jgi:5'(3')-deoxyribonucleotidase
MPSAARHPVAAAIDPAGVAFDLDGVIADTLAQFLALARELFSIDHLRYQDISTYNLEDCLNIPLWQIEAIIQHILDGRGPVPLQPLPGAPEVLERLGRRTGGILFVTARPQKEPIEAWIRQHIPLPPEALDVVATGSFDAKLEVLQAKGVRVFVEDRLETCFSLAEGGIEPVLYRQPWNRRPHPFREVTSWTDIERLLLP